MSEAFHPNDLLYRLRSRDNGAANPAYRYTPRLPQPGPFDLADWYERMVSRGEAEMFSIVVDLTPELAAFLLTLNTRNRRMRLAEVKKFEKIINENRWILTHQGISICQDGVLANGQHRLTAVVNTGKTVPIQLTFGEDPRAFPVIDRQKTRSGNETLALQGESYSAILSAAVKVLHNIDRKAPRSTAGLDNDELQPLLETRYPRLREAAPYGARCAGSFKCSPTGAAVAYYLILTQSRHAHRLDEFWDKLCQGIGLMDARDPILMFRNRLMNLSSSKRGGGIKGFDLAASIILCWNGWVKHRRGSSFIWNSESFPIPE